MSFKLEIKPYEPTPETIDVPLDQMEHVLESFPEKYAVMWIVGKMYHSRNHDQQPTTGETIQPKKRRKRIVLHSWYKTFFCHRRGEKEQRKGIPGGKSGVLRPSQKASKKIGCPATMKVTCYKTDPNRVVFTFHKEHNHNVGSRDDFIFLPVSKMTKKFIVEKLIEGHSCRDIQRQLNQHIQNAQDVIHRDQILDQNEIYNQYKKIQEKL